MSSYAERIRQMHGFAPADYLADEDFVGDLDDLDLAEPVVHSLSAWRRMIVRTHASPGDLVGDERFYRFPEYALTAEDFLAD